MRTAPRSTRRTSITQPSDGKENRGPSQPENTPATSSKKARHRLSTAELARLEDVFKQDTHPSRQQKKDLAAELGMDYKTITIWFQNKRQTSKRGQPSPAGRSDSRSGRTRLDSSLRAVSSPSHNATLDALGHDVDPATDAVQANGLNAIAAKAIVRIKPLIDTLNALASRPRGHSQSAELKGEALDVQDADLHLPGTLSENVIAAAESNTEDQTVEQEHTEQTKEKDARWKRLRTLEWACERQSKRRKLSREAYTRLGSEEVQDHTDPNDACMESALSLLSLASSQVGPPKDVMRGVSLLLNLKHSWHRK